MRVFLINRSSLNGLLNDVLQKGLDLKLSVGQIFLGRRRDNDLKFKVKYVLLKVIRIIIKIIKTGIIYIIDNLNNKQIED